MASRTFTAESMQAAIGMVKENIGPDAVILNTRRIPKKARDPYGKDLFEVIAAESSSITDTGRQPKSGATLLRRPENMAVQQADSSARAEKSSPAIESIQAELDSLKNMIRMLTTSDGLPDPVRKLPECVNLFNRLAGSGLTEKRARHFMRLGHEHFENTDFTASDINRKVIDILLGSLEVTDPFLETVSESGNATRVIALVGPTGSGKTTTIAKLAAELSITRKLKVGVISVDGYRIGALEQIKTYTSIMGIQCMAAFSREELASAIDRMQNKDVILVDTAGCNHFDKNRMQELSDLVLCCGVSSILVLSATTSREDMLEAARHYSVFNPSSYIFTKLDETCRPGVILDQVMDMRLPVSFLTNGQKVPDDLVAATRKKIMGMVFEERRSAA